MTGTGIKASWRSGIGSGSVRCSSLRGDEPRFLSAGGGARRACSGSGCHHELSLSPLCCRNPCALDVSSAIKATAFAASSAPAMTAVFLGLVSTILARRPTGGCRTRRTDSANAAAEQIGGAVVIEKHGFFEIIGMLGLLVLPQLNSAAFASMAHHIRFVDATHAGRAEARSGGEERDDTDANPDAEMGGCIRAIDCVRIGDDGFVLVGVMEGGGRSDDEDVAETHHAHLMGEAVIDLAGGGPHSAAAGRRGVGSSGGGASIEAEGEVIGGAAGGGRSDPISKSARI